MEHEYFIGKDGDLPELHSPAAASMVTEHIQRAYRGEEPMASILYRNDNGELLPVQLIPHNYHQVNLLAGNKHLDRVSTT